MSKRGENIHKRKDGRWEGRYKIERNSTGKTKYLSVYGKTYGEVKSKLFLVARRPRYVSEIKCNNCTLEDILLLWLETNHVKFKGSTEVKYEYLIAKHIVPAIGKVRIAELSTLQINSFVEEQLQSGRIDGKGGLSTSYVRSMILIVNSALQLAVNEQLRGPLNTSVFKPVTEKKELKILSKTQQKQFENVLYSELNRIKTGILISLHTGLRIGEVCALTWSDIDFMQNIIHVRSTVSRVRNTNHDNSSKTVLVIDKPKTASSMRNIPICSALLPVLKNMRNQAVSNFVVSSSASFMSPRTFEYHYHKLLDSCGIDSINYHALRHTFATRCIEAGVDVKSLSEMLGHSNVSITLNTYVHSSMALKREQLEKLISMSE